MSDEDRRNGLIQRGNFSQQGVDLRQYKLSVDKDHAPVTFDDERVDEERIGR